MKSMYYYSAVLYLDTQIQTYNLILKISMQHLLTKQTVILMFTHQSGGESDFKAHDSAFKDWYLQLQNVRLSFNPTDKDDIHDLGPMEEAYSILTQMWFKFW